MRARIALSDIQFDSCFSSPHTRARQTTEIVWQQWQQQDFVVAREPIYLPSLAEVDLGWFQGLKNGEHVLTQGGAMHSGQSGCTFMVWHCVFGSWGCGESSAACDRICLPSLAEADLGWSQGLKNGGYVSIQGVQCYTASQQDNYCYCHMVETCLHTQVQ